jgi:hypothetical protein
MVLRVVARQPVPTTAPKRRADSAFASKRLDAALTQPVQDHEEPLAQ